LFSEIWELLELRNPRVRACVTTERERTSERSVSGSCIAGESWVEVEWKDVGARSGRLDFMSPTMRPGRWP
jgi:hypothetical protein